MSKNVVEPERPQAIWRKRVTWWITKTTRAKAHVSAHAPTHKRTHPRASERTGARTRTRTVHNSYLLLIDGNSGFKNALQCYVIRTLRVLFFAFIRKT